MRTLEEALEGLLHRLAGRTMGACFADVLDLWSYDDVRADAAGILGRLQEGSMPCGGVWPADKIEVFRHWTGTGMQP